MSIIGEWSCKAVVLDGHDRESRCGGDLRLDKAANLYVCVKCHGMFEFVRVGEVGYTFVEQQPASSATPIP